MIVTGLLLLSLLPGSPQPQDEDQATVRFALAESAKEQARVALEDAYQRYEEALRRGRRAEHQTDAPLPEAIAARVEALAAELPTAPTGGDDRVAVHRARQAALQLLRREFQAFLDQRLEAPELNPILAERLAIALRSAEDRKQVAVQVRTFSTTSSLVVAWYRSMIVLTAMRLAISPPVWPPMPSQTTANRPRRSNSRSSSDSQ